jgi:hypothetical protein
MSAPNLHLSLGMTSTATRCCRLLVALALGVLVAACQRAEVPAVPASQAAPVAVSVPEGMSPLASAGMPLRGYNFTYEGVQSFTVDGAYGSNVPPYGGGGSETCCVSIPFAWHAGQTVTVKWTIGHYTLPYEQRKHMSIDEEFKCCWSQRTLEKVIPVQRYDEPSYVQVFFLPNDELEVWVYAAGPQNPEHPSRRGYPVDPARSSQNKTTDQGARR